jgi:hypothetical protein
MFAAMYDCGQARALKWTITADYRRCEPPHSKYGNSDVTMPRTHDIQDDMFYRQPKSPLQDSTS